MTESQLTTISVLRVLGGWADHGHLLRHGGRSVSAKALARMGGVVEERSLEDARGYTFSEWRIKPLLTGVAMKNAATIGLEVPEILALMWAAEVAMGQSSRTVPNEELEDAVIAAHQRLHSAWIALRGAVS